MFARNPADLEFRHLFPARFAARPEGQALVCGQVIPARLLTPVVRRVLPENARPVGALLGLTGIGDLDAGLSIRRSVVFASSILTSRNPIQPEGCNGSPARLCPNKHKKTFFTDESAAAFSFA